MNDTRRVGSVARRHGVQEQDLRDGGGSWEEREAWPSPACGVQCGELCEAVSSP